MKRILKYMLKVLIVVVPAQVVIFIPETIPFFVAIFVTVNMIELVEGYQIEKDRKKLVEELDRIKELVEDIESDIE